MTARRYIFAVDPGPERSGYCLLDTEKKVVVESSGGIRDNVTSKLVHNARNQAMTGVLHRLSRRYYNNMVFAIERVESRGFGVSQKTFDTAFFAGRLMGFYHALCGMDNTLYAILPRDTRRYLFGRVNVKQAEISKKIRDLFGEKGTKSNPGPTYGIFSHALSALGVALTVESIIKGEFTAEKTIQW